MQIALYLKNISPDILAHAAILSKWCQSKQHQLLVDADSAKLLGINDSLDLETICKSADLIVTLGGDGTLLSVARFAAKYDKPVLGVNFGKLGFLTEILPEELIPALEEFAAKRISLAKRSMLDVEFSNVHASAVNDIVIQKGLKSSLIDLDIQVDGKDLMRVRADGLVISTPTGSTAYSLAAGGSIVHPDVDVILMTPICAHSLTLRPIILPAKAKISVSLAETRGEVSLAVDGQLIYDLERDQQIVVSKSKYNLKFVHSKTRDYFEILRTKLNWALSPIKKV